MAVFLIAEIVEVLDERLYASYREQVDVTVGDAGGAYLARGGEIAVLEGAWQPRRIVLVEFDSTEAARKWWTGPNYRQLKASRQQSTRTNMIIVEGIRRAGER